MKENQTQPKSFRITEETAAKLKEIASTTGKNQQETLAMLIATYEMQGGKEAYPAKKEDIEKFQGLMNTISKMYLTALEDGQDAREVAKSYFDAQLTSKDQVIMELQTKVETLEKSLKESTQSEKERRIQIEDLQEKVLRYEEMKKLQDETNEKLLAGKEELLMERTNALGKIQKQVYTLQDKLDQAIASQKSLDSELKQLKKEYKRISEEAEESKAQLKTKEICLMELEENVTRIKNLYEESQKNIEEKYQKEMDLQRERIIFETKQAFSKEYEEKLAKALEEKEHFREKYYEELEKLLHQNESI